VKISYPKPFEMKLIKIHNRILLVFYFLCTTFVLLQDASAQVCADPAGVIYGLHANGSIYPITVSSGNVGAALTPAYTGNVPNYANAMGYNPLDGKFYYFKRNVFTAPQEFVSFHPATNTVTILAPCPVTGTTIINLGCVRADGTGFYCIDHFGKLYFYNISLNTWTVITANLVDQFGTSLGTVIGTTRIYGDIIMDGLNNLWIIPSGTADFGLYKVNAPIPTTPVASLTATQLLPPTTPSPGGASIGGIAFNPTGQIFISTNTGNNKLYRLEDNHSLTFISDLGLDGVGNDLTSCNFPFAVLPAVWQEFSAALKDKSGVSLSWTVAQESNFKMYYIEHSRDGKNWSDLGHIPGVGFSGNPVQYAYVHQVAEDGIHYYRIRQADPDGNHNYSPVKKITRSGNIQIAMWPNPVKEVLSISVPGLSGDDGYGATLYDNRGRLLTSIRLHGGINTINIQELAAGSYIILVRNKHSTRSEKFVKQ
jgi:hypothetical protein